MNLWFTWIITLISLTGTALNVLLLPVDFWQYLLADL